MRRTNNQIVQYGNPQVERYARQDPFQQVQQMLMSFGGLHGDPFLAGMMGLAGDPFQDIFKFSDVHKNVHERGTEGSYVFQSFVSSSKIGPDGRVIQENYFENNMGQHRAGNTISQKQQAYKNTAGVNRIAEERMLNDRGRKIVREKIGNSVEETNHYYNIDEEEAGKFDADWRQVDRNIGFLENHQKYVRQIGGEQPRQMQIGYQPTVYTSVPQRPQPVIRQTLEQPRLPELGYRPAETSYPEYRRTQPSTTPTTSTQIPTITFNNAPRRY